MTRHYTSGKPKTSNISHQPKPVFATQKLAGFAEFAQICSTTPTRNRDKNGNLLSEIAERYQKDYVYNAQNRMTFSEVLDRAENTRNLTEYRYDAFGRRIETIEYLGDSTRNLYDGFSFDVVGKTLLQTRSAPAMTEQKYRAGSAADHPELGSGSAAGRSGAGVANGTRYRYIGDENLVPLEQAGGNAGAQASSSAGAAAKTRSRPNSEYVLYSNGEPVAVNSDNGVSYFGTDILGSVRSVTDKYGNVKASYEYDAFGTPYLSNLDNGMSFGYTGKIFDSATGLYDYGFRDYSPNSARFTTVDPVRDGANWFSYVVNDPVNYIDPFGLTSTDAGSGSKNSLWINNGDGTYTAKPGATLWGLQQETGVSWQSFEGYDGAPESMPVGTTVTVSKPAGSANSAVATGSAIAVATPSNSVSSSNSSNGGTGNASMGGGSSGSSFASVGMSGGGQNNSASVNTQTEAATTDSALISTLNIINKTGTGIDLGGSTLYGYGTILEKAGDISIKPKGITQSTESSLGVPYYSDPLKEVKGIKLKMTGVSLCEIAVLFSVSLDLYAGYEATIRTEDIGYGVFKTVTGLGTTYLVYKGATIGAELGTFVCPGFGTFVGGFLGGLAGEYLGQKITSIAESKLFPDINSNSDVFLSK